MGGPISANLPRHPSTIEGDYHRVLCCHHIIGSAHPQGAHCYCPRDGGPRGDALFRPGLSDQHAAGIFSGVLTDFALLAIPLFILAGAIMGQGGIAPRIVNLAMVFVGRFRGGLGMVSVLATMFFSGISGSSSADTAAIGSVTLPAMKKRGYPPEFATALVAASGGTAALVSAVDRLHHHRHHCQYLDWRPFLPPASCQQP